MRHDFVTIADLPKEKLMYLLEMAKEFENHPNRELLTSDICRQLRRIAERKGGGYAFLRAFDSYAIEF